LTGGSGKIGVRRVAHPVARALVRSLGRPLTGTSANPAGAGGCAAISQLHVSIREKVDLILDAGTLAGGPGSTVVDVTGERPLVLRHGAVAEEVMMAAFEAYPAAPP
jgi:L-threonylcarbamoyladenylate synthase